MSFSRRSFLEKAGLGAGGALLGPIAQSLVAEAMGQPMVRKRAILFLCGNGLHYDWNFTPPEIRARDPKLDMAIMDGPTDYGWPGMLRNLAAHRRRMLLVDGLANELPKSQHSAGYGALSCFTAANNGANEYGGPPGNVTIDQFLADKLSYGQPIKSALFGVTKNGSKTVQAVISASGPEKPEPHFISPMLFFGSLFGPLVTNDAGLRLGAHKDAKILDALRADVSKLQAHLAGPERRKLDHYLQAMEEYDKRQKAIGMSSCKPPMAPTADTGTVEDRLESMNEMAMLALVCGLTSVVGVSAGCGMSHQMFPTYQRIAKGTQFEANGGVNGHGHDPREIQGPAMDLIHNFHAGLIARQIAALSAIKEGDKTLFDNTVIVYTSDNAEQHHSSKKRWPLVVIGNAGGKLKSDGRFLRYPAKGKAGWRSLADFYCSIAHAVGVPTDTFGKGGNEPVQGPLPEIMA